MTAKRFWRALSGLILLVAGPPGWTQQAALEYRPDRVPVGQVFHFVKSQRDGSHVSRVSVYIAASDRVEGLKWDDDGDRATLVTAELDWSTFSVRRFEAWQLARGETPARAATLEVSGNTLKMSLDPKPLTLTHFPWHSFDFDFTSLNLVVPHLRDPRAPFSFWRTDFVYSDPPTFAEIGAVSLTFERIDRRGGQRVRRYRIGGPGLEGKSGTWWADEKTGLLVEFEIPVGDEPGYADVRLRRLSAGKMSREDWASFQRRSIGDPP